MGTLIRLDDYKYPWKEVFSLDGAASTLQVYVNEQTGEAEVVQMNDDGEAIRTEVPAADVDTLVMVLKARCAKKGATK